MRHKTEDVQTLKEKLFVQKKKLVIGIFIFIAVVSCITGFYIYHFKQQTDAKQLEYEAYKYYLQKKFSQAGSLFAQAYEKKKNVVYLINAGYAYSLAGDDKKAIEYLNKVASMEDENFSNLARFKIAMIYLKNNDKASAIKFLNEILHSKTQTMKDVALFKLAKISDKKEEAQKYYQDLINKFPSSPMVESAKAELQKLETSK